MVEAGLLDSDQAVKTRVVISSDFRRVRSVVAVGDFFPLRKAASDLPHSFTSPSGFVLEQVKERTRRRCEM